MSKIIAYVNEFCKQQTVRLFLGKEYACLSGYRYDYLNFHIPSSITTLEYLLASCKLYYFFKNYNSSMLKFYVCSFKEKYDMCRLNKTLSTLYHFKCLPRADLLQNFAFIFFLPLSKQQICI